MEIRQLQTFRTVAELNSFTKASQKLQYSQASVTAHIKQMEEELGYPLFDRLGKHIQLTTMGKELIPHVVELLSTYSKIKEFSPNEEEIKGEIRIGASETITVYKLATVISDFKNKYPKVKFSLINDNCVQLKERVHRGELDIAITLEPNIVIDPLLNVHLWSEELIVYVGANNLSSDTVSDVEGECIIHSDQSCLLRKYFEAELFEMGIRDYNHLEFTSMEAMKQCVVSGLGISLMPYISVRQLLEENKIKILHSSKTHKFYAQVVFHKNKWLSSTVNTFVEMLLDGTNNKLLNRN